MNQNISLESAYSRCELCPRKCLADRPAGQKGFCGQLSLLKIASICAHFGEEPPISGHSGSGTIFYTGCSTGCFFCQNYQISKEGMGTEYSLEALVLAAKALIKNGVHNINHVTPDHFWPHVRAFIAQLRAEGETIPQLINCSGYQSEATAAEMAGCAQIFLPDFKFADPALAKTCMGREDYPERALRTIEIMVEASGFLDADFSGGLKPATQGVLVRHLVLPGHADNSVRALKILRERFGRFLPLSIMSQYMPTPYCRGKGEFTKGVSADEYRKVLDAAESLEFENIFCQEPAQNSGFFPDFSDSQPFAGNT